MKILIALALFAVAFADEVQVVNLPRAAIPVFQMPDIRPLMVPQEVIDAVKIMQPVMRDAEVPEDLSVRFVDAPLEAPVEAEAVAYEADEGLKVHFVDLPLDFIAEDSAALAVEDIAAPDAVRFVDAPLAEIAAPAAEEIVAPVEFDEGVEVHFVDFPLDSLVEESAGPDAEDVVAPIVAEIAVPEPVRIAEAPLPAFETVEVAALEAGVEPVKIAMPRLPGKQYADPRLR